MRVGFRGHSSGAVEEKGEGEKRRWRGQRAGCAHLVGGGEGSKAPSPSRHKEAAREPFKERENHQSNGGIDDVIPEVHKPKDDRDPAFPLSFK
ncbi:hypothetical protein Nepgr_018654 [Nepenthes gracilis]|uniref:Uncharacterized protein n=1 Tax=Nepenthes gracilis TaxID=150966 RepID=A0AAD3XTL6_NEPGR|nr:hypothetical protein Nepgr_018654 [Nepenthes gracilis]